MSTKRYSRPKMCQHKWILDRFSFGKCIYCLQKRQFPTDEIKLDPQDIMCLRTKHWIYDPDSPFQAKCEVRVD